VTFANVIGSNIAWARDHVARFLLWCGLTPNRVTVLGFLVTLGAAGLLALGAGERHGAAGDPRGTHWLITAGCLMFLAGAFDMLDGALARVGQKSTLFGGFLDSTLDRFSDIALFLGCAAYYSAHSNVTYNLLAVMAMANALLISYARARAESLGVPCKVGYWERGERFVALMLGCFFHGVPAALWQLGILPLFTAVHRLLHTYRALAGGPEAADRPWPLPVKVLFFDFRRGGVMYDLITASNIAFILFAPITDNHDIIGDLIRSVVGAGSRPTQG
jgi:CDP-diacylglycerol--glycerol-3-phosphate 3-phosphatidyltransferase